MRLGKERERETERQREKQRWCPKVLLSKLADPSHENKEKGKGKEFKMSTK